MYLFAICFLLQNIILYKIFLSKIANTVFVFLFTPRRLAMDSTGPALPRSDIKYKGFGFRKISTKLLQFFILNKSFID